MTVFTIARAALAASVFALAPLGASAATINGADHEYVPHMEMFVTLTVREWLSEPVLLDALRAQNMRTAGLTEAEILDLDGKWREADQSAAAVQDVMQNAAAGYLSEQVALAGGLIAEVILMDAKGLNVAITHMTSDYWQGDEAKHQQTYGVGANAIYIGEMEVDESTGAYLGQASVTVTDPETGAPIGAITVGLLPDMF